MQELMRHSTIRVTLDTYTQAVTSEKRAAQTLYSAPLFFVRRASDKALTSTALNRGPASADIASNSGKPTSQHSLHEYRVYSVLLYCLASHPIQFERRSS
jgi:hypothetical protein